MKTQLDLFGERQWCCLNPSTGRICMRGWGQTKCSFVRDNEQRTHNVLPKTPAARYAAPTAFIILTVQDRNLFEFPSHPPLLVLAFIIVSNIWIPVLPSFCLFLSQDLSLNFLSGSLLFSLVLSCSLLFSQFPLFRPLTLNFTTWESRSLQTSNPRPLAGL